MTDVLGGAVQTGAPWVPTDSTFGARLALVRWKMGWNIKEAALACGIPAASWRSWEMDGALPRRYIEICALVASRAGCDRDWLMDGRLDPERVTACYGGVATGASGWIPNAVCTYPAHPHGPLFNGPPTYPESGARPNGPRRPKLLKHITT